MASNDTIIYAPSRDEGTLKRRNNFILREFNLISKNLCDNLIDHITKGDRSKMINQTWVILLRDQSNESMIKWLDEVSIEKEKLHNIDNFGPKIIPLAILKTTLWISTLEGTSLISNVSCIDKE